MQQYGDTQQTSEPADNGRATYTAPVLVSYGSVKALTAGGSQGFAENQRWQTQKRV